MKDYTQIALTYCAESYRDAGPLMKKAIERFQQMLYDAGNDSCIFYYSREHADAFCSFADGLEHWEANGWDLQPQLQPWQIFVECATRGFRRRIDGHQLARTIFVSTGRRNLSRHVPDYGCPF